MHRLPCENNYPCVHGICKLTLVNTTFCFCDFPYSGETCNTTAIFWTTSFVLVFSVIMILIILNVRSFKLTGVGGPWNIKIIESPLHYDFIFQRTFGSELQNMSKISNLSPSSSFYSSSSSFEDCPQMTTQIDELHQINSTIRVSYQLCQIVADINL